MISLFHGSRKAIYIAEIGLNHNGDVDCAIEHVDAAVKAGADAVKFQTFRAEKMNSVYTASLLSGRGCVEPDNGIIDFFRSLELSEMDLKKIKAHAEKAGIIFFSSPFDQDSVDLLESLDVPLYKIASSEITNPDLIKAVAQTGKPVILSTGMTSEEEIEGALSIINNKSKAECVLMHCVSKYPLDPGMANCSRVAALNKRFGLDTGFSDHTDGTAAAVLASVFGARYFEKHFKLSGTHICPDQSLSLAPQDFANYISEVESAIEMAGNGDLSSGKLDEDTGRAARRSLFASRDIFPGTIISEEDIIALRPGTGISPLYKDKIIGKRAVRQIPAGVCIEIDSVEGYGD